ncbi:MAG: peptidoglycan DD-metalloendopeptidase family protein [Flavobacteriales bacterium]|nr:peptidoglycan DD-metalloendopeptidase family protein [Flavobacteriales bacterium]MCX7769337.1 peptidoglycan DD-metalloendopeptidase family protein [Flavobacteriales bacterium]MDW8410561.1 peptidoglycan DD-metalloendopeptidase family protein [Flavobacteriales bacterium]
MGFAEVLRNFLILSFFYYHYSVWGQNRLQLQEQRNRLLKDIELANQQLRSTSKTLEGINRSLQHLEKKIALREALILTYQNELALLNKRIDSGMVVAGALEKKLNRIKEDYAQLVRTEYKLLNGAAENLYLLAARDFNDAYLRRSYFRSMRNYRRWLAQEIAKEQAVLADVLDALRKIRQEKALALQQEQVQRNLLAAEQAEKEKLKAQLRSRERELRQLIARKEKERRQLEVKIKKLIEEELAAERRKAEARARKEKNRSAGPPDVRKPSETTRPLGLRATPDAMELSGAFENNKGRLPWPVEKAALAAGFGVQAHAFLRNVTIKNDGVDIAAPPGAPVRAVFRGQVSGVFPVQGFDNVVILRHGEYLTVYANLHQVTVTKGMQVEARQILGRLPSIGQDIVTMNFQVRKGAMPLNPLQWLHP